METTTKSPTSKPGAPHIGRKIARMREILGVKQEVLAQELGISQQAVSRLEQSEKLEDERLEEVAKILGVPPKTIENFNEEAAINIIANTFNSSENSVSIGYHSTFNFNPIDKLVETMEENKRLYDALLKEKDEKIALMERILGSGK